MCPVCIATAALIAGTTSTGGLAVLIAKAFRRKKVSNQVPIHDKAKENRHGH